MVCGNDRYNHLSAKTPFAPHFYVLSPKTLIFFWRKKRLEINFSFWHKTICYGRNPKQQQGKKS